MKTFLAKGNIHFVSYDVSELFSFLKMEHILFTQIKQLPYTRTHAYFLKAYHS